MQVVGLSQVPFNSGDGYNGGEGLVQWNPACMV